MENVKDSAGRYESPLRIRQAKSTRAAVLNAARDLFIAKGYGATTVEQIASRAGVSKPTVFSAAGNKQTLLAVLRDVAMAGDDEEIAVGARPAAQQVFAEPNQYRATELLAGLITAIAGRYAEIDQVLRGAVGSGDEALRELWETAEQQRHTGARMWADSLAGKGPLRLGIDTHTAADILWLYMSADVYHRLVRDRGWSPQQFQSWLTETLTLSLLPPAPPGVDPSH